MCSGEGPATSSSLLQLTSDGSTAVHPFSPSSGCPTMANSKFGELSPESQARYLSTKKTNSVRKVEGLRCSPLLHNDNENEKHENAAAASNSAQNTKVSDIHIQPEKKIDDTTDEMSKIRSGKGDNQWTNALSKIQMTQINSLYLFTI